tara:strand:- start:786 stop:1202 length:417 start_codon:yes stop_codon:yes gene_type:complete
MNPATNKLLQALVSLEWSIDTPLSSAITEWKNQGCPDYTAPERKIKGVISMDLVQSLEDKACHSKQKERRLQFVETIDILCNDYLKGNSPIPALDTLLLYSAYIAIEELENNGRPYVELTTVKTLKAYMKLMRQRSEK